MKTIITTLTVLLTAAFVAVPVRAQVTLPDDREALLETARSILEPEAADLDELLDGIVLHPFLPRMDVVADETAPAAGLTEITLNLVPDGTISMGGRSFLLFEGRPVGVGEYLSVEYRGRTYQVEVTGISTSSYTLRMNDEEIEKNL